MNKVVMITKHANGVMLVPTERQGTPWSMDEAVVVPFLKLDDFHRDARWGAPVKQILEAIEPFLLAMDAEYVAANTPKEEPKEETEA